MRCSQGINKATLDIHRQNEADEAGEGGEAEHGIRSSIVAIREGRWSRGLAFCVVALGSLGMRSLLCLACTYYDAD